MIKHGVLDGIPVGIVDGYPKLQSIYEMVDALPAVKAWNADHKKPGEK
jgi:hypothetical protein